MIDLGPDATLAPTEAGGDGPSSAPIGDGGSSDGDAGTTQVPDAAEAFVCGLAASPNPSCASCIEAQCCDESKKCASIPTCAAGLECIKDCMAVIQCILTCEQGDPSGQLQKVTFCSSRACQACTPGDQCTKLGTCCYQTFGPYGPDSGPNLLRDVCRGHVLDTNESECQQHLGSIPSDASACK